MVTFAGQLIQALKRHEGVKAFAYRCTSDKLTIGVGRCVDEDGGIGLSDDEIDYLLLNDIERCDEELENAYGWYRSLNKPRRDAMINLCFNLGLTRLRGFVKALNAMSRQQYDVAADEFMDSRWASQVGDRAIEVTEMIRHGEYL
jgi:lysozyme|tara:strand:- start:3057 stop:3491 length:435 start_codon:yes stop_codon:yes gene_type:complete